MYYTILANIICEHSSIVLSHHFVKRTTFFKDSNDFVKLISNRKVGSVAQHTAKFIFLYILIIYITRAPHTVPMLVC